MLDLNRLKMHQIKISKFNIKQENLQSYPQVMIQKKYQMI